MITIHKTTDGLTDYKNSKKSLFSHKNPALHLLIMELSATFYEANRNPIPKWYEKATKMLRICYEFDCVLWEALGSKMQDIFRNLFIIKRLINN